MSKHTYVKVIHIYGARLEFQIYVYCEERTLLRQEAGPSLLYQPPPVSLLSTTECAPFAPLLSLSFSWGFCPEKCEKSGC